MENNKIIIVLLLVIIVLLVVFAIMFINPTNARTDTKITVTSNNTLHDGQDFSIVLTDINGTPLTNQTVNISITDANGGKNPQQVTTDGMGNGILKLNGLTIGNYSVNVTYGGNDNYSSYNLTQKIEIKEVVQETTTSVSSSHYNTEPVYDGHTICYKDGIRGVYSRSGEFFADEGQFH